MVESNASVYLGIDFGTTASAIGYVTVGSGGKHSEPNAIKYLGKPKIPTAVYIPEDTDFAPLVGEEAINAPNKNLANLFTRFKLSLDNTNPLRTLSKGRAPKASELAVLVYRRLSEIANANNVPFTKVVICHPVGLEWSRLIKSIASQSGIKDCILLTEPLACLYYANYIHHIFDDRPQRVLLIDFGGGTCDLFLLEVKTKLLDKFVHIDAQNKPIDQGQLTYTNRSGRCSYFGGGDIDQLIVEKIIQQWEQQYPRLKDKYPDLYKDPKYSYKLEKAASTIKERISTAITTASASDQVVEEIHGLPRNTKLNITITKSEFEQCVRPVLENAFTSYLVNDETSFFRKNGIRGHDIDRVILTGGSSNLPWLQDILAGICPNAAAMKQIHLLRDPEMSVAYGAAIFSYYSHIGDLPVPVSLEETLKISLGGKLYPLAHKNTILPYGPEQFRSKQYIRLERDEDTFLINLFADAGSSEETYRSLGEEREIHFDEPIKGGRFLSYITYQIEIDQVGQVVITLYPLGKPKLGKKAFFEPLNVW